MLYEVITNQPDYQTSSETFPSIQRGGALVKMFKPGSRPFLFRRKPGRISPGTEGREKLPGKGRDLISFEPYARMPVIPFNNHGLVLVQPDLGIGVPEGGCGSEGCGIIPDLEFKPCKIHQWP